MRKMYPEIWEKLEASEHKRPHIKQATPLVLESKYNLLYATSVTKESELWPKQNLHPKVLLILQKPI